MEKNYAYESGSFMALSKMMRDAIREFDAAESDLDRKWALDYMRILAAQTDDTLAEFGYAK